MLDAIRAFIETQLGEPAAAGDDHRAIEIATAVLLMEMVHADGGADAAEHAIVLRAVRERFGLTAAGTDALVRLAAARAKEATDYYQFTSLVNKHFSAAEKEQLVESLWRVAYADDELNAREQHLIRKIADLLYIPQAAYIAAKMRAKDG